jgi:hypothetical protein
VKYSRYTAPGKRSKTVVYDRADLTWGVKRCKFSRKWLLKTEKHFSWKFESSAILFIVLAALSHMIFRKKTYSLYKNDTVHMNFVSCLS